MTTNLAPTRAEAPKIVAPASAPRPDAAHGRVASLDGLRGIAILTVLIAHLLGTRNFLTASALTPYFGDLGNLGVRVFFVISGFLITSLLLKEVAKTGHISLKGFYLRRTFLPHQRPLIGEAFPTIADSIGSSPSSTGTRPACSSRSRSTSSPL